MIDIENLYIFNVYNLMSVEVSIHSRNHDHNLCHKHVHHLQKFPPAFFIYDNNYYYVVKRTQRKIHPPRKFSSIQYSTVSYRCQATEDP